MKLSREWAKGEDANVWLLYDADRKVVVASAYQELTGKSWESVAWAPPGLDGKQTPSTVGRYSNINTAKAGAIKHLLSIGWTIDGEPAKATARGSVSDLRQRLENLESYVAKLSAEVARLRGGR